MNKPLTLAAAASAWGTPGFDDTLKQEIERLDEELRPLLQRGMAHSSALGTRAATATIISSLECEGVIWVITGIFYSGIVAGCSCADDPSPVDEITEYCELEFTIESATGKAQLKLLGDDA